MRMRAAIYARYSSKQQNPASIQDQIRNCKEFAARNELEVLEEHIFTDRALSGVGGDRPGFLRLKKAIGLKPKPFDVVLTDDSSRLSRRRSESARFQEECEFAGMRIVFVSQGIDTQHPQSKIQVAVHELVDDLHNDELAFKTRRGLTGRATDGFVTGGRCYGYDNVPVPDVIGADGKPASRRQVNEAEAEVVRRIFKMYAEGGSLKSITKTLNAEHVPPPRKRRKRTSPTWCPSAIREMLRRELYIGKMVWNRKKYMKKPGTNSRVSRERPKSEWLEVEQPELRIIAPELWDRVQVRIAMVAEKYNYGDCPGLIHRASTSPNFLTGFMKCGVCGHNLTIVTGRSKTGQSRYGCPINFNRGACANEVKERATVLEERLFTRLQNAALRPEAIEYAIQDFEHRLTLVQNRFLHSEMKRSALL